MLLMFLRRGFPAFGVIIVQFVGRQAVCFAGLSQAEVVS